MRISEECPFITPCGWCSRKGVECEIKKSKKEYLLQQQIKILNASQASAEEIFFGERNRLEKEKEDGTFCN